MPNPRPVLTLAASLLVVFLARSASATGQGDVPAAVNRTVCIRGTCFDTEIALTERERARGLMHRATLGRNQAMLFVFPREGRHHFWMKNTLIPLDIIFIGGGGRIVSIVTDAPPCRKEPCAQYGPSGDAAYALEINGGLSDTLGFAPGDPVEFR